MLFTFTFSQFVLTGSRKSLSCFTNFVFPLLDYRLLSRAAKRCVTVRSLPGATCTTKLGFKTEGDNPPCRDKRPVKNSSSGRNVAEKIVDLGNMIATNSPNTNVTISAIRQRSYEESLKGKVKNCNKVLKTFCNQKG